MKNLSDKRSGTRTLVSHSVSFELTSFESGRIANILDQGSSIDLSVGGMGMKTRYPLHAGQVVRLFLPVTEVQPSLPVLTEVMWSSFVDGEFRTGLRFLM